MSAADVLADAADCIEARGLYKGSYLEPGGRSCCTFGAIAFASEGSFYPRYSEAYSDAADALNRHLDLRHVADWNDDDEQTTESVVATLRACAASLRASS